jgi:TM2 domain-containing membrane protein YozV
MNETTMAEDSAPTVSTRIAYFWLLTLFFGAHRFYVGKWLTGSLYVVLALVVLPVLAGGWPDLLLYYLSFYALLLVVDAALIPGWVKRRNEWFVEDFKARPNHYLIPATSDIAPWARGHSKKGKRHIYRNYLVFWLLPFVTGICAAQLHSLELFIIPIVVLAAIGLISTLDRILAHHPAALEIPGVGPAIERVAAMRSYFWEKEPRIGSAVWGLFRHWKDFRPYWTLALVVAATIVIEGVIAWRDNNQYIEPLDAGLITAVTALLAGVVVLVNLVPITAVSFHYSLSGRRTTLRFMTVGAVIATVFGYAISSKIEERSHDPAAGKIPSFVSSWRLEERMENPDFRNDLTKKMDIFLWYFHDLDEDAATVNADFRNLLQGILPNDETDALEFIDRGDWGVVVYHHLNGTCHLENPDGSAEQTETSPEILPTYSLLAFVFKNTEDMKWATLDYIRNDPQYEGLDPLSVDPLGVIDLVSSADIYYQWSDDLSERIANPECQSLLLDWPAGDRGEMAP